MTVLLKIVNNFMTALLESLNVLLENIDLYFILLFYKSGGLNPSLFKSGEGIAPLIATPMISKHAVVCQWPRKPCDAQVCYLREPPLTPFQPVVA